MKDRASRPSGRPFLSPSLARAGRFRERDAGFSLVEILTVIAVAGVVAAIGLPMVRDGLRQYALNTASRNVAAEIRSARYGAVAKNRTLVLRFNCPSPSQYRLVEFTGNPTIDDAADRCSLASYPYPDPTPATAPTADGPVLTLDPGIGFGAVNDLSFDASGRIPPPTKTIEVADGTQIRRIFISPAGRITEQ
jgi:prepilin-type N-terminal cleavage/methylation domain-containing protein